jgi:hypothetical protein
MLTHPIWSAQSAVMPLQGTVGFESVDLDVESVMPHGMPAADMLELADAKLPRVPSVSPAETRMAKARRRIRTIVANILG